MKRFICYLVAIGLHLAVLFGVKAPPPAAPPPDKTKYLEVTLEQPPPPPPPEMTPPPQPPVEEPPPPQPKPEPPPPAPDPEILPQRVPEPPPPMPIPQPAVAAPVQKTTPEVTPVPVVAPPNPYLNVTQPSYASRVEPDYPAQARRLHQQGTVTLALYINALGSLDKVEVVKSSGHPLLDEAAADAMKESRFHPAYQGPTPMPSRAEVSITFRLEQ